MVQKTSINIKPCNIGSSEPHNRRTAEYLTRINKEKFYIRTDLMPKNYKPQNKMFHFCKTFCSKITLVNTIQNVILNPI